MQAEAKRLKATAKINLKKLAGPSAKSTRARGKRSFVIPQRKPFKLGGDKHCATPAVCWTARPSCWSCLPSTGPAGSASHRRTRDFAGSCAQYSRSRLCDRVHWHPSIGNVGYADTDPNRPETTPISRRGDNIPHQEKGGLCSPVRRNKVGIYVDLLGPTKRRPALGVPS